MVPLSGMELLHSATTGRKLQCFQGGLQNMRAQTKNASHAESLALVLTILTDIECRVWI